MRKFITFIVDNPHFTILLTIILVLLGVFSISKIKISQDPMSEFPELILTLTLPGASPTEMQQSVVIPIEEDIETLDDIKEAKTTINLGSAFSYIRFEHGVDIKEKERKVTSILNNLKAKLPSELETHVKQRSISDLISPFVYAVTSETGSMAEIEAAAKKLEKRLSRIRGLKSVREVRANQEVHVFIDLARMAHFGITLEQTVAAIRSENRFLPAGVIPFGKGEIALLPPKGGFTNVGEIEQTVLISPNGNRVFLKDFSEVKKSSTYHGIVSRIDGRPCRLVTMNATKKANILDIKKKIEEAFDGISGEIPETIDIQVVYDQETGVRDKLAGLFNNLYQGILILFVVLLFAVGYRSGLVITLMLPLALVSSLTFLSFTEFGIQQISIAGFIVALGLIVDNGIVITENTYILLTYKNKSLRDAVIEGTSSVIVPLLSSTLTTVLAFTPLFLLTTDEGLFLRSLSVTIWIALGCSLFIAITFTTLLLSRIGTENRIGRLPGPPSFLNGLIPFRDKVYQRMLRWVIRHPWTVTSLVLVMMCFSIFTATRLGVIVFPESDDPYFSVEVLPASGTSIPETEKTVAMIEERLMKFDPVIRMTTLIGTRFPLVNVGLQRAQRGHANTTIFVEIDFSDKDRLAELVRSVDTDLTDFAARARIRVSPFKVGGGAVKHHITIDVSGESISEVSRLSNRMAPQLSEINGVKAVHNPGRSDRIALGVIINREKAASVGLTKSRLDPLITMLTYGWEITDYRDERSEEIPILIRASFDPENPMSVFDRLIVTSETGRKIPLGHVVTTEFREPEQEIKHLDFLPTVKIGIDVHDKNDITRIENQIAQIVRKMDLGENNSATLGGLQKEKLAAFAGFGQFSAIIAIVIFSIFVLQFRSFVQPGIVYAAIPLCLVGAVFALYLTEQPFSFLGFVGLTSLMGIVVNDSILMVDEGNHLLNTEPEKGIEDISVECGRARFMPILLTSVTTITALIPMAVSETMFKPMAIVIIGGLMSSTVIMLFFIPLLFRYLTRTKRPKALTVDTK